MIAMREERIPDRRKHPMLGMAKGIVADHLQGIADLWLMLVVPMRVIPTPAGQHFFRRQAEEEEVFLTCLPSHLDGGTITGADSQGSIHHELHVARATGLIARRRDLLGYITGGNQSLRKTDVILGEEQHFKTATDGWVRVDDGRHIVDQLDDELGQVVGRRRLAGEEKGAGWDR